MSISLGSTASTAASTLGAASVQGETAAAACAASLLIAQLVLLRPSPFDQWEPDLGKVVGAAGVGLIFAGCRLRSPYESCFGWASSFPWQNLPIGKASSSLLAFSKAEPLVGGEVLVSVGLALDLGMLMALIIGTLGLEPVGFWGRLRSLALAVPSRFFRAGE